MNRILLPVAVLAFGLGGCATLYQSLGLATAADLASRDEKIAVLEGRFDSINTKVESAVTEAKKVAEVEGLMKELQGKVDQLPQETLKRLADILAKAAAETQAP